MTRKMLALCLVVLLIVIVSLNSLALEIFKPVSSYKTLKGEIYIEGPGLKSILIFSSEDGKKYLIGGQHQKTLNDLAGIPLIITGKLLDVNDEIIDGEIEVELFNTYYPKYIYQLDEVIILGTIKRSGKALVLITSDQQVIALNYRYDSLKKYSGELVLVKGKLTRISNYEASLDVKSYKKLIK